MAITGKLRTDPGIRNFATGALNDTGTVKASIINLGFIPRYVRLVNATDRIQYEWFEGMAAGTTLKQVAVGTGTLDTADVAITVGEIETTTADAYTVYDQTTNTVGTPSVAAAEGTDNSRLNEAGEVFHGILFAAAAIPSSKQCYFVASA